MQHEEHPTPTGWAIDELRRPNGWLRLVSSHHGRTDHPFVQPLAWLSIGWTLQTLERDRWLKEDPQGLGMLNVDMPSLNRRALSAPVQLQWASSLSPSSSYGVIRAVSGESGVSSYDHFKHTASQAAWGMTDPHRSDNGSPQVRAMMPLERKVH